MTERIELAPGYSVSRVINGLWQLSLGHGSQPTDRRRTTRTLLRLVDAGFTTFDCADIYLGVEELLGGMLRELRASRKDPTSVQIHSSAASMQAASRDAVKSDPPRPSVVG